MRVLVIEDYGPLRESITRGLQESGYAVDSSGDGNEGLWFANEIDYDVIVLDLMLPGLDGLSILKRLRSANRPARVLILTARDGVGDRVEGLGLGADDYMIKPFAFQELLARIQALTRRKYDSPSPTIQIADLTIDTTARTAMRAGEPIDLTAKEYSLLEYLARRSGQIVTRAEIWDGIYDFNAEPGSNVIDVHVATLRKKLEGDGSPRLIHTRRGMGYVLEEHT
jgi:DNA-binding response OmpR family regulator